MNKSVSFCAVLITLLTLSACGGPFADYSNRDLRKEFRSCNYERLSPAGAQRCNNIKKECEKRFKDNGFRC